jgi:hypothetical protein
MKRSNGRRLSSATWGQARIDSHDGSTGVPRPEFTSEPWLSRREFACWWQLRAQTGSVRRRRSSFVCVGKGLVYIFTAWLQEGDQSERRSSYAALLGGVSTAQNYDLQRWPYFNYLWYYLSRDAGQIHPVSYQSWMAAPIPGRRDATADGIATLLLLLAFAGLFFYVRRYSLAHPERLDHFSRPNEPRANS